MIVVWPGVGLDVDIADDDESWGWVHRSVGGLDAMHRSGDHKCWCSPICVRLGAHTDRELSALHLTSLH